MKNESTRRGIGLGVGVRLGLGEGVGDSLGVGLRLRLGVTDEVGEGQSRTYGELVMWVVKVSEWSRFGGGAKGGNTEQEQE